MHSENTENNLMLELCHVSLSYGKKTGHKGVHQVLDSVSLRLYQGETLGIIGENGCGKTTILRLMAGILGPTRGQVKQRPDTSSALLTIGLGFRPQLSGRDNAIIAAMLQGSTLREAELFLEEIKDFSELGDAFDEPVKTYSAGMKSRLGFTTALLTHVDIMLIDEVLSVGDAHFREKAEAALKQRIAGEQTVVFVSHSSGQIESLCDRAVWLYRGKIAAEGDTSDVVSAYHRNLNLMKKSSA